MFLSKMSLHVETTPKENQTKKLTGIKHGYLIYKSLITTIWEVRWRL